jgi:antitoxin (DNA-binding transcriptional repressor) of toxin-antitoxin stability system
MTISITKLRSDLYQVVDQVIRTGKPVDIIRHGHIVQLVAKKPKSKLANLKKHSGTIVGNPDDLVHVDWSHEWNAGKNL